jgi:hypothetical protein
VDAAAEAADGLGRVEQILRGYRAEAADELGLDEF